VAAGIVTLCEGLRGFPARRSARAGSRIFRSREGHFPPPWQRVVIACEEASTPSPHSDSSGLRGSRPRLTNSCLSSPLSVRQFGPRAEHPNRATDRSTIVCGSWAHGRFSAPLSRVTRALTASRNSAARTNRAQTKGLARQRIATTLFLSTPNRSPHGQAMMAQRLGPPLRAERPRK